MNTVRGMEEPIGRSAVLTTAEAATFLGLARSTLEKLRIYGDGPVYVKYGKAVRYLLEDLESWRAQRRATNTSVAERLSAARYPRRHSKVPARRARKGFRRGRR